MDESNSDVNYFPVFSQNSTDSTAALFEARKFFKEKTIPYIIQKYPSLQFSDLYQENALFGILDPENDIIIPSGNNNFNGALQNFVSDAFDGLREYIAKLFLLGNFSRESPFFNLQNFNNIFDISSLYQENIKIVGLKFKEYILFDKSVNSKIKNDYDFNRYFIKFLKRHLDITPATRTETVLFYNLKSNFNGLSIKIANDKAGDDTIKYLKYFLTDSFGCFSEGCTRFGFRIDKNIPWILTPDLKSAAWYKETNGHRGILLNYNILSVEQLFKERFEKSYINDLEHFKNAFYECYKLFFSNGNEYYTINDNELCVRDLKKLNLSKRTQSDINSYFKKFDDAYWIKVYTYFRNLETKKGLTQNQFDSMVRELQLMTQAGMLHEAMRKLNLTFKEVSYVNYFKSLQKNAGVVQQSYAGDPTPEITL
jgi:hypothetical protein